jgi:protein tyrosine phosphatase type 4A
MAKDMTIIDSIKSPHNRFVIFGTPNNANLPQYVDFLLQHNIKVWVRVCNSVYDDDYLIKRGFTIYDLSYRDGTVPSPKLIKTWLTLLRVHMDSGIAIHCVSGLGRAPTMVAIALMESGENVLDVITRIRKYRIGAFNLVQLKFLEQYKSVNRKWWKIGC